VSFTAVIADIVTTLQTDTDLAALVTAWGKTLTVKKGYKQRAEIGLEELPIIRVTTPEEDPDTSAGHRTTLHKVRLYCLFLQNDCEQAVDDLVIFREKILDAMLKNRRRGGTAQTTIPGKSANDEGTFHPSYCIVMEFDIQTID
jgi:hypothetical protein